MTDSEYANFLVEVEKLRKLNPSLRRGQIMFNLLFDYDRELANSIRGGDSDPFYVDKLGDKRIEKFLKIIRLGV